MLIKADDYKTDIKKRAEVNETTDKAVGGADTQAKELLKLTF